MSALVTSSESLLRPPEIGTRSSTTAYVNDVTFTYPSGLTALRNLSITVPASTSLAVVGPSGCGKSTLLQLLTGLRKPTRGTVEWSDPPRGVLPMSMVFQADTLLPWKTAAENVALHYRLRGQHRRAEVKQRVRQLLEMVGLEEFADAYPYELSGGMRRRIAFLTAVAPMPAALLLDEPFSSLDEPTRVVLHQDVLRIIAEFKMTVVLITHDLAEAITLCDQVAILSRRPAQVIAQHEVPFGSDRNPLTLRQTPQFLEFYALLWDELSRQIAGQTMEEES